MIGSHPSEAELRDFLIGNLPDREEGAVVSHLAICERCVEMADAWNHGDTLVELLAAAATRVADERSAAATPAPQDTQMAGGGIPALAGQVELDETKPPAVFGNHPRYKPIRSLGDGGMGSVWLAEHLVLERMVAIKVIRPGFLANPGAMERFRREARAVARLSHPNIVAAFDAEEAAGTHFLVMEYVSGENLGEVLRRGPLPLGEACRAVRDAALGLAHAHASGLVHRDVKPPNLIRAADGVTKVLDFGLASAGNDREGLTGENFVLGTPDFIAPEQAEDARAADSRSDVYSLGCTLFALLSGRAPYAGGTTLAKLDAHRHAQIPGVPDLPPAIDALIKSMLSKRSAERPSARDVAEALDPFCDPAHPQIQPGASLVDATGAKAHASRRTIPRWGIVASLLLATIGVLATTAIYSIQRDDNEIVMESDGQEVAPPHQVRQFDGHIGTVRAVAYSADGRYILSASGWPSSDRTLRLWNAGSGKQIWVQTTPVHVNAVAFKGDERIIIAGFAGLFQVRGLKTGELIRDLAPHHKDTLFSVAVSSDGRLALTGGDDQTARVWDLETGEQKIVFRRHADAVVSVAFSPEDRHAVTGSTDGSVRLWETATGKEVNVYRSDWDTVGYSITFTPDGSHALFGENNWVRLWNVETGVVERSFQPLPGSNGFISVAVSNDGKRILAAGTDKILRLWDRDSGRLLRAYAGHKDMIWAVAFSPNGELALSGGGDQIVAGVPQKGGDFSLRLWRTPNEAEVAEVLARPAEDDAPAVSELPRVTDYRELHDAPLADLKTWLEKLPADFRPVALTSVAGAQPPRFNAVAIDDGTGAPFDARFELDNAGHPDFRAMEFSGWALRVVCTYSDGDRFLRQHVWVKDGREWWIFGRDLSAVEASLGAWKLQGMRPIKHFLYSPETGRGRPERHYGISLESTSDANWDTHIELDEPELNSRLDEARQQGRRPLSLDAVGHGENLTFAVTFISNPSLARWEFESYTTTAQYEAAVVQKHGLKMRPQAIISEVKSGDVFYRVLWTEFSPTE